MKKILLFSLCALMLFSCKHKSANDVNQMDNELNEIVPATEYEKDGLTFLRATNDTITTSPAHPVIIALKPDTALPHVPNPALNKTYCDNTVTVSVLNHDSVFFTHRLTKADLEGLVDSNIRQTVILYSASLIEVNDECVSVEVDLCVPHSDEQTVVRADLYYNGKTAFLLRDIEDDFSSSEEGD